MDTPKESLATAKNPSEVEQTIEDWGEAVSLFYDQYGQLTDYLNKEIAERRSNKIHKSIGQCPVGQLIGLVNTMQEELMRLTQDMDNLHHLSNYRKLKMHTGVLNQLNGQAEEMLRLASLPSL